ncbi:hypothetical protein AVEN_124396-1 [Araneus ventricosus]|uniref:Uncharacterized protein n=1 Tax=Araneus ventricosus TaxID=182803 RepID=A0A4Y2IP77_ARAVE|nr:hypothetical protein AVEN_124396-1 [Araneus ventricosus]
MLYYWTFPIVVDIQTVAPEEFSMPAITFCNVNGIKPWEFCKMTKCVPTFLLGTRIACQKWPNICEMVGSKIPKDFKALPYNQLLRNHTFSPDELQKVKKPVEEFFSCKIISSTGERNCTTDKPLVGSYYSISDFFGICYTINSRWSRPNKTLEKLTRADKIEIEFYVDLTDRHLNVSVDQVVFPKYNYPTMTTATQLLLHNNFISISPYRNGFDLLGGKSYQLKLKQEKKYLLPAPYQTNCTDYMAGWKKRGGIGPLNPMMVVEECKYNLSLTEFGCVPYSVDYPHNDSLCTLCRGCSNMAHIQEECENLLGSYNQPCDFISYKTTLEEKTVLIAKRIESRDKSLFNVSEVITVPRKGYDCAKTAVLTRRCQTIQVEISFGDFEITTTTYKPKFESFEILSVIGSYMGIYLGISMFSVSKLFEILINRFLKKRKKGIKRMRNNRHGVNGNQSPSQVNHEFRRRNRIGNFNT